MARHVAGIMRAGVLSWQWLRSPPLLQAPRAAHLGHAGGGPPSPNPNAHSPHERRSACPTHIVSALLSPRLERRSASPRLILSNGRFDLHGQRSASPLLHPI